MNIIAKNAARISNVWSLEATPPSAVRSVKGKKWRGSSLPAVSRAVENIHPPLPRPAAPVAVEEAAVHAIEDLYR
jgi:hypothetical protein